MKSIFFSLLLLTCSTHLMAQRSDNPMKTSLDSAVNRLMTGYMKSGKRVGASIGIEYKKRIYTYNYGETHPGSAQLPGSSSVYEIGSITKTFTGLMVAHAIVEGKIGLNDDVRKFLPGNFPNLQYPNTGAVRIAHLLGHTAQLPNSFGDPLSQPMSTEAFLKHLLELRIDSNYAPRYRYSNAGYQLLGLVLEKVYGQPYDALLRRLITSPLDMRRTGTSFADGDNLLKGYGPDGQAARPVPPTLAAAGGIKSSVNDMLNYLRYQSAESALAVRLSHRIIVGDVDREAYGFQWAIGKTWNWDQYMRIDGGTNGFRSFCVMYPVHGVNIVMLTNQKDDSAGMEIYKVVSGIYASIKKEIESSR